MTPEQIAAQLTPAQKSYMNERAVWSRPRVWAADRWMTKPPANVLRVLMRHGLVDSAGQLLELGLGVRAVIQRQAGDEVTG